MRKLLAVLLGAVMVVSLAFLSVGAVDGTAVKSAEDFAKMTADGTYYLDADIAIAETYATPFTGTLDGNGHTVTVSVPMFSEMNGTVKNLIVKGQVDNSAATAEAPAYSGSVAQTIKGNATFENIKNEAVIKGMLTDYDSTYRAGAGGIAGIALEGVVTFKNCENTAEVTGHAAGGILGSYDDASKSYDGTKFAVTFENCVNSGHISASDGVKVTNNGAAGGILGIANKIGFLTFKNCKNTGKVEADNKCPGPAGGIVSYVYTALAADGSELASFQNCTNTGEVISADSQAGGIAGWTRVKAEYVNCLNSGFIHTGTNASGTNNGYCGGIACRVSGDKKPISTLFKNCKNTGNVNSGRDQSAGICAYHNGGNIDFINCENTGKMTNETNATGKAGMAAGILANSGNNDGVGGVITFTNCKNSGELVPGKDLSKNNYTGGICAYIYGTGSQYGEFTNCVNTGKLHLAKFSGQIVAYTNTVKTVIKDCVGAGQIVPEAAVADNAPATFIGCSSAAVENYPIEGNKIVENDGTEYFSFSASVEASQVKLADADPAKLTVVSAADAAAAITAIGKVGASNPGASGTLGYVAPGTAVVTPGTGDTALIVMIVCAVSLLGMGIALRARKA